MKCPDCGASLTEIPFAGGVLSRCFKCGGFWADSYVINKLTGRDLSVWRRISVGSNWFSGGKGVCPADGMKLARYIGENIPPAMSVQRCARCGKWWFPGDSLFAYKPALETKMSYSRLWGLAGETKSMLLPVMTMVIFTAAIVWGTGMVQRQQQLAIGADSGVRDVAVTYAGEGNGVVVFKADSGVESIAYKQVWEVGWKKLPVQREEGIFVVQLSGLVQDRDYYFLIGGQEYKFKVK